MHRLLKDALTKINEAILHLDQGSSSFSEGRAMLSADEWWAIMALYGEQVWPAQAIPFFFGGSRRYVGRVSANIRRASRSDGLNGAFNRVSQGADAGPDPWEKA